MRAHGCPGDEAGVETLRMIVRGSPMCSTTPQASRYRMTTGAIEELVPTNHVPRHDRGK